jgi:NAD-dependent SIR2 family protein deacetylase
MDYKTFVDAFAHNMRTQEHLLNLLSNRVDDNPQFSLFLGAGASITSGVKTAAQMVADWRRRQFASYKGHESFHAWLDHQDWYEAEDEYATLFELTYDQPAQRRAYIEKAIAKAKPSWGYAYLASLMKQKMFNVVFTTNFDDLLNDACYNFTTTLRPMVCAHDSAVTSVRVISERPKIIKLHGDYLYDSIKNTSTELQSLAANMRDKFSEFAKQYGLVVLGYSGFDQSVMDLLDVLVRSDNYFRNGIYWCIRKGSCPGRRLQQLLRNDRVFWVEVEGFDEFVSEVARSSNVGLPEGVCIPHATAFERAKHLLDDKPKHGHPVLLKAYSDTHEVYGRIKKALDEIGLSGWQLGEKADPIGDMSDKFFPFLKAIDLVEKGKIVEACKVLRILAAQRSSHISRGAWDMLMQCLLSSKSTVDEARRELAIPPCEAWQDSSHYSQRSYYALYLCQHEDALKYSERALELNAEQTTAKVNRAMAHLFANNNEDFAKAIRDLQGGHVHEQFRAAVCIMEGELSSAIHHLQQAIVLGRYAAPQAFQDVVFRAVWGNAEFEGALKPFMGDQPIEYKYRESCPMSPAELILSEKFSKKSEQKSPSKLSHRTLRRQRAKRR